jgi:hypothetical protein
LDSYNFGNYAMTLSDTNPSPLDLIRNALLTIEGSERTGAQLRSLIDNVCPGFDLRAAVGVPIGPGALTKFLSDHFADLVHAIGKRGGDKVYLIGEPGSGLDVARRMDEGRDAPNLWAVFASPGLRQQLVIDRTTGRSFAQPQGASVSENEIAIPPIKQEEFKNMAEEFTENVPHNLKQELRLILDSPNFIYDNWIFNITDQIPLIPPQMGSL